VGNRVHIPDLQRHHKEHFIIHYKCVLQAKLLPCAKMQDCAMNQVNYQYEGSTGSKRRCATICSKIAPTQQTDLLWPKGIHHQKRLAGMDELKNQLPSIA
jgi:hypothetical protein